MYQWVADHTGILNTADVPCEKIKKERHCIYIRGCGTTREEIVIEESTFYRNNCLHT
jgi:hypothetical protein